MKNWVYLIKINLAIAVSGSPSSMLMAYFCRALFPNNLLVLYVDSQPSKTVETSIRNSLRKIGNLMLIF